MAAALLTCASFACAAADLDVAAAVKSIVGEVNAFRQSQGLQPLEPSQELAEASNNFAAFMAKTGKYGHEADDREPTQRARAEGYNFCIVSENLAWLKRTADYESPQALAGEFVAGWKRSAEHRENLLDPDVTQTGVGVARGGDGRYFAVQMFGRPESAAIRFTVQNRSLDRINYRVGDVKFALASRAVRAHLLCRGATLEIQPPSGKPFAAKVEDGARYEVRENGTVERVKRSSARPAMR